MIDTTTGTTTRQERRPGRSRDPLLRAKTIPPELPSWFVARPRVERQIADGVRRPLTLVTGPPGAGKTLAIAGWAAADDVQRIAWVSLDEYDNRPKPFWSYVVSALRQVGAPVSSPAASLARGEPAGHVFLLRLASALASCDPPTVLVLDDLHWITDQSILTGFVYVLKNARTGLRVVAASRIDPLLPLHAFRLAGDLTEIRAQALAFTLPEASLLMRQHGIALPDASLEDVTQREEGWAAGLRLAAMSMKGHPEPELFAKNLVAEDGAVAGYLVEEVLNAQTAEVRELLLCTSILDRVGPGIASEITGDKQAGDALPALSRANAFVVPAGEDWYRYHSLFRDVLRLKLRREQPGRVSELHRRAARWYSGAGDLPEAVRHAGEADDWELAACLVVDELAVPQLLDPDGTELPGSVLRRVPDPTPYPQPLLAAAALALADGRPETGESYLAQAGELLERLAPGQQMASRFTEAMIAFELARSGGDHSAAAAAADRAGLLLWEVPDRVRPAAAAQALGCRGAMELWSGSLDAAARTLTRTAALAEAEAATDAAREHEWVKYHADQALAEALRGRLSAAEEAVGRGSHGPAAGTPSAAIARALVHLERNELNGVRAQLKAADAVLHDRPDKLVSAIGCLVAARASLAEGRVPTALEMLRRARNGWSVPPWLEHLLLVTESQACAGTGDWGAAVAAANRAGPETALDARVALTRAWLAAGDVRAARQTLRGAAETPTGKAPDRVRVEAWLADALVSIRSDDPVRGRRSLEQALRLSEGERLRLPFAIERAWLVPALRQHPDLAHAHRHLLEAGLVPRGWVAVQQPSAGPPAPMIVEQLSGRERDVLRRVADMLTTEEIAAELYISVNTVKSHLKTIFRKLSATDRRQAVRHAKQLGVI